MRERRKIKLRHYYALFLVLCAVFTSGGCATRNARHAPAYASTPHVYPATRYALRGDVARHWVNKAPPGKRSGYWLFPDDFMRTLAMELLAGTCGYIYSLSVEVPISLVADTVLIPMDAKRVAVYNRDSRCFREALLGDGWPVSSEELLRCYHPDTGEEPVKTLVANPAYPQCREKLERLADTGIALDQIASTPHLDDALGKLLLERAKSAPGDMLLFVLHAITKNPVTPPATLLAAARAEHRNNVGIHRILAEHSRATTDVLSVLLDAAEPTEEGSLKTDRLVVLMLAARHPAQTPALLLRYLQVGDSAVSRSVVSHANADEAVLNAALDQFIEWRSVDNAHSVARHRNTTPALLHRIAIGLIGPMADSRDEPLMRQTLYGLSSLLYDIANHPDVERETLENVLRYALLLNDHVSPDDQFGIKQFKRATLKARERLGP